MISKIMTETKEMLCRCVHGGGDESAGRCA